VFYGKQTTQHSTVAVLNAADRGRDEGIREGVRLTLKHLQPNATPEALAKLEIEVLEAAAFAPLY